MNDIKAVVTISICSPDHRLLEMNVLATILFTEWGLLQPPSPISITFDHFAFTLEGLTLAHEGVEITPPIFSFAYFLYALASQIFP